MAVASRVRAFFVLRMNQWVLRQVQKGYEPPRQNPHTCSHADTNARECARACRCTHMLPGHTNTHSYAPKQPTYTHLQRHVRLELLFLSCTSPHAQNARAATMLVLLRSGTKAPFVGLAGVWRTVGRVVKKCFFRDVHHKDWRQKGPAPILQTTVGARNLCGERYFHKVRPATRLSAPECGIRANT